MKILAGLALTGLIMVANASAGSIYTVATCGAFSNPAPNYPQSGTWVCPTAASLGVINPVAEYIVYNSDYSNGEAGTVVATTSWTFSARLCCFPRTQRKAQVAATQIPLCPLMV